MEVSDEEVENEGDEENKLDGKDESESSSDEDSESDKESNSQSSDTDIECTNRISPKKVEKSNVLNNVDRVNKLKNNQNDSINDMSVDSSEAIITNPDMQMPEVTIGDSGSLQLVGENSSSESSNETKGNAESLPNTDVAKRDNLHIDNDKTGLPVNSNRNASSSSPNKLSPLSKITVKEGPNVKSDNNVKGNDNIKNTENSSTHSKNEAEEEDDDIFICTPTRPKSPPVIVIDDDQENDDSCVSDTYAVKSPPYSTSAESLSYDENPVAKSNPGDDSANPPRNTVSVSRRISDEGRSDLQGKERNTSTESRTSEAESPMTRRKRKLSFGSSCSEDDVQIVTPVKKTALTGAIRTFKPNNNNAPSLKPPTPTVETVKRNLEKESLNQISKSPVPSENSEVENNVSPEEQTSVPQTPENLNNPQVIDVSKLSDKDKEIIFLRGKLNCIMTAYKIQSWKCNQEREELRHNMNLILMEMRASLEADKKQAVETLARNLEKEKQKCIEETKRKQWCASCLMESRYACCWNTSYCSVDCQKRHFPEHRNTCTQVKSKNIEIGVKKSPSTKPSEGSENKKVFIFNMKAPENTQQQQIPVSKPQIQVVPAKNTVQIATSTNSNNFQFVLAPVKSPAEPAASSALTPVPVSVSTSNSVNPNEQSLASIALLKKKNTEPTVSVLKKEVKEQKENPKEETSLEDIYFPSPPNVNFEGYESASPEPNLVIMDNEESDNNCDTESQDSELPRHISPEPDVVLSDADDVDNEMVHIGYGVDVKAKFLNKCLIYGQTAKKLTRCLVDIIFPDTNLLATCSAFGQKSNVTKLTRAALPTRKVHAIIDFVRKRFPEASKSEVVLAINMKCKEARVIINKKGHKPSKKSAVTRKLLVKENDGESRATVTTTPTAAVTVTTTAMITTTVTASPSVATTSQVITTPAIKTGPNVVCVKSSNQSQALPLNKPIKPPVPNILRCSSQILIRPKPVSNTAGNAAIIKPLPPPKPQRETVKQLLANKMNLSMGNLNKDGTKLVMTLDTHKPTIVSTHPVNVSTTTTTNTRPYIIIGSQANSVRPSSSSSVQHSTLPIPSHIKK